MSQAKPAAPVHLSFSHWLGHLPLLDLIRPLALLERYEQQGGGGLGYLAMYLLLLFGLQYPVFLIHQLMRATGHLGALLALLQLALQYWFTLFILLSLLSWLCYRLQGSHNPKRYGAAAFFHAHCLGFAWYVVLWCGLLAIYQGNSAQWLGQPIAYLPWLGPVLFAGLMLYQLRSQATPSRPEQQRHMSQLALLSPLLLLVTLGWAGWLTYGYLHGNWDRIRPLRKGELLPNFVLEDHMQRQLTRQDFRDQVLLIEFWAPWCGACQQSMPILAQLQADLQDRAFQVLPIHPADSSPVEVTTFLQSLNLINMATYRDTHDLQSRLHIHVLPTTLLISRDGYVRSIISGVESYGAWMQRILPWLNQPNNNQQNLPKNSEEKQ